MEPLIYQGVTSEAVNALKDVLKQYGIYVPDGNEGPLEGEGFAGNYYWNQKEQTLTLEVNSKPWFISNELIQKTLDDVINNFLIEAQAQTKPL